MRVYLVIWFAMTAAWGACAEETWPDEIPDFAIGEICAEDMVADTAYGVDECVEALMRQPITGVQRLDADALHRFVCRVNPEFEREIAEAYLRVGERYGIRGDIALCQSIVETGWFKFADGTAVTPDQHNYCGLGVTRLGMNGCSFDTVEDGVTAQIQHLYAYATDARLPEGERLLDPRFKLVARGVAPTWEGLSGRWAANDRYARLILKLYVNATRFANEIK